MRMKIIKLNILTACILIAQHGYAIQELSDQSLSSVTGQDGISITHEMSKATITQANWIDYTDQGNMKLGLQGVEITGNGQTKILSKLDFDVGATANGTGVKIKASVSPFQAAVQNIMLICDTCTTDKQQSLGSLNIKTTTPFVMNLETTNGLFNRDAKAHLDLNLQNASISYGLNNNNLILKDFNFNLAADGYLYIDRNEGIVLTTKARDGSDNLVDLGRVQDTSDVSSTRTGADAPTNPGVNIDIRYGTGTTQNNVIRMGASGAIANGKIFINSDQSGYQNFHRNTNGILTGTLTDYQALGVGGLHFGMSGEFTRTGNTLLGTSHKPTTLEIGHTGHGSYAIEFSDLAPLKIRTSNTDVTQLNSQNAYIDFGDIYINTVSTNNLNFIYNDTIEKVLGKNPTDSNQITYAINAASTKQNAALIAVRGFDFQSIARTARFISDNSIAKIDNQTAHWGIGIPIYNLNANLALFSKSYKYKTATTDSQGLGYNLVFSTDGYGIDQKTGEPATTSIIVVDGGTGSFNEPVNYYAGLRNIDSYMKSDGLIGFENDGIYIKADNLLFAAKAEIAIGQLPGSLYNCPVETPSCTTKKIVPIDNFAQKDDVLSSIAFKIDGKGELLIIPGSESPTGTADTNFLSLKANFEFNPPGVTGGNGSYFSIINEDTNTTTNAITSSSVNLNKLQGRIGLESRIKVKSDTVVMDNQIKFNYENTINSTITNKVLKAELALSPTAGTMQKIADIAITGGTMRSTLGITPR
ncbi:hypothetical protein B9T29_04725 [Acinetobacter sp. ANC 3903]|uniref:DUF6160 family protein n=1 Tax=Acinetobacter sp. ANC 3903 TaxID=1977883 RepID=UPI000A34B0ED|nr:DUF6160 family protein [Acinetobacter sp. ANC 3903]OTG62996.1 hypothetical protein B9T29_04725 [Acinetobacter sp. ANC 3903]